MYVIKVEYIHLKVKKKKKKKIVTFCLFHKLTRKYKVTINYIGSINIILKNQNIYEKYIKNNGGWGVIVHYCFHISSNV